MWLFIDTNTLLEMYHLSGPDLEELRKLVKLIENGKLKVVMPQQVVDEFWRNREGVIADALKKFRETKAQATVPNIIRAYPESAELKLSVDKVNSMVKQLAAKAREDIEAGALKADEIIAELFAVSKPQPVTLEVVERARLRSDLGNPPGKKGSMGDAVNWEHMLTAIPEDEQADLVVLSADGDYASDLSADQPKEFLSMEWAASHPDSSLRLETSLAGFLAHEFADITLADEVDKTVAIERFEESDSFVSTHFAVAKVSKYADFTEGELKRILTACVNNTQVNWILGDPDVRDLATKAIKAAYLTMNEDLWGLAGLVEEALPDEPPF